LSIRTNARRQLRGQAHCSKQLAEFVRCQTGIPNDSAHGERLDRIMPRKDDLASPVAHHDVLALSDDLEAGFLQSANGIEVIDARDPCHDYTATSTSRTSASRI
jgi:hypothetical protein